MNKNNLWYIDQRAEYLANMYLSRRDDLIIERQNHTHDRGIDILIDICHSGTLTGRVFGVRIRAERSASHIRRVSHNLITYRYPVSTLEIIRDIPFPVVLLLMVMEDDSGYYNWINRTKLDQAVNLSLKTQSVPFERLTEESMNMLINEIDEWYERRIGNHENKRLV
ncbi:DUF4365 domain-containing protein [Desulfonema magnum]|uniref:DUF4365 n=1 Tax=Desulfonema magnum TaxID=45655 RepID=A0A975BKU1_9BACT|nr:DUF4365 domain-containing protein [Desulfonema magnum]QTA87559.1 DUF4365 [Desulfonema magnum]